MTQQVWAPLGLLLLAVLCNVAECRSLVKRQVHLDASLDPSLQEIPYDDEDRDKREVQHRPDPKFAVKNAILGFVFHKINSFIDQKTAWVDQLDHLNIAKNKAHGIYPPEDSIKSITGAITEVIGQKLQAASPLITLVTSKLTSGSLGGSSSGGFNLGGLLGGGGGGEAHASVSATAYGR